MHIQVVPKFNDKRNKKFIIITKKNEILEKCTPLIIFLSTVATILEILQCSTLYWQRK